MTTSTQVETAAPSQAETAQKQEDEVTPEPKVNATAPSRRVAGFRNVHKLFTHHDRAHIFGQTVNHMHKTLGMGVVLHFIYRFRNIGEKDMAFDGSLFVVFCLVWHSMLSLSSVIFKIPATRVRQGSMIWPEYRFHSIVFAHRSMACMFTIWLDRRYGNITPVIGTDFRPLNVAIVFLTMYFADQGAAFAPPSGTKIGTGRGTIQELDAHPAMRFFFSYGQFVATTNCLFGLRRFSTQFMYVWIIQVTAFIMTLIRKNIPPHTPMVVLYGIMIAAGIGIYLHECYTSSGDFTMLLATQTLMNCSAVLRMGFGLNKYLVWTITSGLLLGFSLTPSLAQHMVYIYVPTLLALLKVAHTKITRPRSKSS